MKDLEHLHQYAIQAADQAFYEIKAEPEHPQWMEPHQTGWCSVVSFIIAKSLAHKGYTAIVETHEALGTRFHDFVVCQFQPEEIAVDGTWQQFLPKVRRGADKPKVLIGRREKVRDTAISYGVTEDVAEIWTGSTHLKQSY
jgi:hypothetical protein